MMRPLRLFKSTMLTLSLAGPVLPGSGSCETLSGAGFPRIGLTAPEASTRQEWRHGGTFTDPNLASTAGRKLVIARIAKEFRVVLNIHGLFDLMYLPRD
jgi:hypothetical protein